MVVVPGLVIRLDVDTLLARIGAGLLTSEAICIYIAALHMKGTRAILTGVIPGPWAINIKVKVT